MSYTRVSVKKPSNNAGRPKGKAGYIMLFPWVDVEKYERDDNGVKVDKFKLKDAFKPIGVYATPSTQNMYHEVSGEGDATGFIHHVAFSHPGDSLAFSEFVENNTNVPLGAILIPCQGDDCRIAGLPCNGLKITQDTGQANNEATKHDLELVQEFAGPVLGHISKALVPVTEDDDINAELGLPYPGSSAGSGGI